MQGSFDVLVVGAGITGLSVAAALSDSCRVAVLEREAAPGRHASGRAVAILRLLHGQPELRRLAEVSLPFLGDRHPEIDARPLVHRRGMLLLARADQLELLERVATHPYSDGLLHRLDSQALARLVPQLRQGYAAGALLEDGACDIDVPRLMDLARRRLEMRGGRLICGAGVRSLSRAAGLWRVETAAGGFSAPVIVNAAGAWADGLARLAGAAPVGLTSRRRTILDVEAQGMQRLSLLPTIVDMDLHFYLKPESGRILISPADETIAGTDETLPEELDVTLCLDRIRACFDTGILSVRRVWAGLRSYTPDRLPVVGFDAGCPGFFWLAGQGAVGIQTVPAMTALAASGITGDPLSADYRSLADLGQRLSPDRFAPASP
ncbi:NAD(P)/FAD-dependent oxidoreductase [Oceanicola sp. S124]|uniref:NAD(P)/FAD-dependent oxidoreductase n=1 Tax=Oceanicola sp. S124 TaxID=1042378 RepID=UPI0002557EA6|nr:FAD-dependent oxidoreductase [Oceanicola sp. S124]